MQIHNNHKPADNRMQNIASVPAETEQFVQNLMSLKSAWSQLKI